MTATEIPAWAQRDRRRDRHQDITFEVFKDRLLGTYRSSETRRKYSAHIDDFVHWMGLYADKDGLTAVTEATLEEVEDHFTYLTSPHWADHPGAHRPICASLPYREEDLGPRRAAISALFAYAIAHGRRTDNPAKAVKLKSRRTLSDARTVLVPEQIREGLYVAQRRSRRAAFCFGAFFGPGVRADELHLGDIPDFRHTARGHVIDLTRKRGKGQIIDSPDPLVPLAHTYWDDRTEGPMVVSDRRRTRNPETGLLEVTRLHHTNLRKEIAAIGKAINVPDLSPHDGRATAISLAIHDPSRPSMDRIRRYFGHDHEETTSEYIYSHQLPSGFHVNPLGIDWTRQAP